MKVPSTSPELRYTQHKIPAIRIKDEIRYLHSKKQQLNLQIYHLHISLANTWNNTWPHIQHTIQEKLRRETKTRYKTLDKKLKKKTQTQTMTPQGPHTFYPRVINNTNIPFTNSETALLQKGLEIQDTLKKEELDTETGPRGRNSRYPTSGQ